jgi:hypothetical protein
MLPAGLREEVWNIRSSQANQYIPFALEEVNLVSGYRPRTEQPRGS